jgi:hypothetical protein
LRRFTGRLSGISNSPKTSKQVLSLGLRAGLNVIILRGGAEEEDDDDESERGGVDDVVDVSTTLAFELEGGGDSEDADGGDELITVDELFKEAAEGLRGGEERGDKRKLRMGRDSTGLDREGSCS